MRSRSFKDYLDWLGSNQGLFTRGKNKVQLSPQAQHPGKFLAERYIKKENISQTKLAKVLGCTHAKINEIINGKRAITPEFALKLEQVLGEPAEMWVSLQASYDLWLAREKTARTGKSGSAAASKAGGL